MTPKTYKAKDLISDIGLKTIFLGIVEKINEGNEDDAYKKFKRTGDKLLYKMFQEQHKEERNLAKEVREWVGSSSGVFYSSRLEKVLHLSSKQEKKNLSQILSRLYERGIIERSGKREGCWRRIERECIPVEWWKADVTELNFKLPFELEKMIELYAHTLVVIAGTSDVGKTGWMLDFINKNIRNYKINYYTSELFDVEFAKRVDLIEGVDKELWQKNLKVFARGDKFEDVIEPDGINLVDFVSETEGEFYKIPGKLKAIFEKLNKGIAIVAIQKMSHKEFGLGGEGTMAYARLYLTINPGIIKIVKPKAWKGTENPKGKVHHFKLVKGNKFVPMGVWHYPEPQACPECAKIEKERKRNNKW